MCTHLAIGFLNRLSTSILHTFQLKVLFNENRGRSKLSTILINCLVGRCPFPALNGHTHQRSLSVVSVLNTFGGPPNRLGEQFKKNSYLLFLYQYMYNSLLVFFNTVPFHSSGFVENKNLIRCFVINFSIFREYAESI